MAVDDEHPANKTMKEIEAGRVRTHRVIATEGMSLSDILSHYEPNVDLAMSMKKTSEEMRSSTMREVLP